jgi:hypothetical protein
LTRHVLGAEFPDGQDREIKALQFLSSRSLARQRLSVVSRRWYAYAEGQTVLSGLLPTGEGITYVTSSAGEVSAVHLATVRYGIHPSRRVRKDEPCGFDCPPRRTPSPETE